MKTRNLVSVLSVPVGLTTGFGWLRASTALTVLLTLASPALAQDIGEITVDIIERFLRAHTAEQEESQKTETQREELNEKIRAFNACAETWRAAGNVIGGGVAGIAARAALRAKCGATSDEGWRKELAKLDENPEKAANAAGKFRGGQFGNVKQRIIGFLAGASGYSDSEKAALNGRKDELGRLLAREVAAARPAYGTAGGGGERGGRGRRGVRPNVWTADLTWEYIGDLFGMLYLSGANMFEAEYQSGEWTQWEIKQLCETDQRSLVERAFLGADPEAATHSEWWRVRSIDFYKATDNEGKEVERADTAVIEALFKWDEQNVQAAKQADTAAAQAQSRQEREAQEYAARFYRAMRELVRARGRMPGEKEGNELMVPAMWGALWNLGALGALLGGQPTPESIKGATVGTPSLTTPAGTFATRHIRFRANDGGTLEWWLSEQVPGGQAKFVRTEPAAEAEPGPPEEGKQACTANVTTMELIGKGTGAKSELGVK
ncbi:MAG: hypothetical protein A3K13_00340 [Gemmatimonadetes bacterium RIFCSPLOWO2_12_FULL_68_9]|nr:MAG: hypothetical protein A3K13_00340 [Gemmatimonadetes bacterium RIFCSPLOWO2_12_FULL_68_9]